MGNRVAEASRRVFKGHVTAVAYLALLLASSSAAYAAATIGSANVIDNSLQSVDLRDGAAVKGVDIVNDSVAGADVNEATLNGVGRKFVWTKSATEGLTKVALISVGGYTLKGSCSFLPGGDMRQTLWANGPAGDFQEFLWRSANDEGAAEPFPIGETIASSTDTAIDDEAIGHPNFRRVDGTVWIHSGATLLRIDIHGLLDFRGSTAICTVYGMVTTGV